MPKFSQNTWQVALPTIYIPFSNSFYPKFYNNPSIYYYNMKGVGFNFNFKSLNLFDIWFSLLVILLVAMMMEYIFSYSFFNLIRLAFTGLLLVLSFAVFLDIKNRNKNIEKQKKELAETYAYQIKRKDARLKELLKHNELLMKTSVRQAKKSVEISDNARELAKKIKH